VLFKIILKNSYHVLYPYLPENQYQHYYLTQRPHNKALIPKTTYLSDRDYIMLMLYKNCYYPVITPCCGTVITHCAYVVCYFREVYPFIYFIIAMYVHHLGSYCFFVDFYYRAMQCIRGTSHGPVSVCVCLSVTSRCSTETAKRRITQTTPHYRVEL